MNDQFYNHSHVLVKALEGVTCWNYSQEVTGSFKAGETIRVLHAYDATSTVIQCVEDKGRTVYLDGKPLLWDGKSYNTTQGKPSMGYRFIVSNRELADVLGVEVPKRTIDIVGDIIDVESGKGTAVQVRRLSRSLAGTTLGEKVKVRFSQS